MISDFLHAFKMQRHFCTKSNTLSVLLFVYSLNAILFNCVDFAMPLSAPRGCLNDSASISSILIVDDIDCKTSLSREFILLFFASALLIIP